MKRMIPSLLIETSFISLISHKADILYNVVVGHLYPSKWSNLKLQTLIIMATEP